MNQHIEQAIQNFRQAGARYARTERYYAGRHDLAFATEKFQNTFGALFREFALNLCPAIVDAVRDKLRIEGFGLGHFAGGRASDVAAIRAAIDRIWFRNRMAVRAGEIHKEALKNGDAYAVVWPDERGDATIYPQRAASCTVVYDEDQPGRIAWAAKHWREAGGHTRLNIYYPDRIEKFISRRESSGPMPAADDPAAFVPADGGRKQANPFGVVPVFHFANNAGIGSLGESELTPAIPLQDGLNKSILDMLVAMEYSAFRQRWVAGIEIEVDKATGKEIPPFHGGVDRLWVASDPNARFGDLGSADLEQFLKVKDSFRIDIASVTGTPLHYFLQTARQFASGEALRKNETRFLAKVRDRQAAFGQVWAELMAFALTAEGRGPAPELTTHWADPAPTEESDILKNIILKKQIGISTEQALKEAGYGETDIRQMTRPAGGA